MGSVKRFILTFALVSVSINGICAASRNVNLIKNNARDNTGGCSSDTSGGNIIPFTCQCWHQDGDVKESRQNTIDIRFKIGNDDNSSEEEKNLVKKDVCKNDRSYIHYEGTGSCYKFHNVGATWIEAKAICEMEGAHLVKIDNQAEADLLVRIMAANPATNNINTEWKYSVLIGFRYIAREWKYTDGTNLGATGYTKWMNGQPDNSGGQYCGAVFRSGELDDMWCFKTAVFICESKS